MPVSTLCSIEDYPELILELAVRSRCRTLVRVTYLPWTQGWTTNSAQNGDLSQKYGTNNVERYCSLTRSMGKGYGRSTRGARGSIPITL